MTAETAYASIVDFLCDPTGPKRPALPPGGCCGPKDNDHMTYLAMTLRKYPLTRQISMVHNYAALLASLSPNDPCLDRLKDWHNQLTGRA